MAKGISLHIGLNSVDPKHYAGWSGPLNACEADAEDMQTLAKAQGFSTTLLKTKQGTRAAVKRGITAAATALKAGDIFLLTYSGHGGQVPDRNSDEPDLKDETWCLYDGELLDDELHQLWKRLKAKVRVLVLSDSCHSGTVTRLFPHTLAGGVANGSLLAESLGIDEPRYRFMPEDVAFRTYRKNRVFYDKLGDSLPKEKEPIAATVRLISGCQDNQVSLDGTFNGLFTGMLLRVWNNGKFKGNYAAFHKAIVKRMPPTQTPNHFIVGQANGTYDGQGPFAV